MDKLLNFHPKLKIIAVLIVILMFDYSSVWTYAFSPETRVAITLNAFKLMPPSLRTQLEKHKKECLMGTLGPMINGGEQNHYPGVNGELIAEKIFHQVDVITKMINNHEPFKNVIYEMGVLSHHITDLNFPLTMSGDGKEYYNDFANFCRNKEDKFKVVFYGFYDPYLSEEDIHNFSAEANRRSSSNIPYVKDSFSRARQGSQAEFDDRSTLFGIAALSFSHAVTDTARLWIFMWKQAHGDLTGTPHLETFKKKE